MNLPTGFRIAQVKDFIQININHPDGYELKVGELYLAKAQDGKHYIRAISKHLEDINILDELKNGCLFI